MALMLDILNQLSSRFNSSVYQVSIDRVQLMVIYKKNERVA